MFLCFVLGINRKIPNMSVLGIVSHFAIRSDSLVKIGNDDSLHLVTTNGRRASKRTEFINFDSNLNDSMKINGKTLQKLRLVFF